jgi:hypothetical protein
MNRNEQLITLRPSITTIEKAKATSAVEIFQNESLRPIIKFQNDILIEIFKHHIDTRKGAYYKLSPPSQKEYIANQIKKDKQLHQFLLGIIMGHFTIEEWKIFVSNEKDIKKRITNMIIQRLQDQMLEE